MQDVADFTQTRIGVTGPEAIDGTRRRYQARSRPDTDPLNRSALGDLADPEFCCALAKIVLVFFRRSACQP